MQIHFENVFNKMLIKQQSSDPVDKHTNHAQIYKMTKKAKKKKNQTQKEHKFFRIDKMIKPSKIIEMSKVK